MPTVSIIIPTYKHRDYVLETLDSVFAQTFTDYEIIVVNDGSPDDTSEVLRPLAAAGRIQYIEQPNQGQAAARNCGLRLAKGQFIAFLDDDDLWPPDKLQWQVDLLREFPEAGVAAGSCDVFEQSGEIIHCPVATSQTITFESLFSGSPFCSPGQTLIRAEVLAKVGRFANGIDGCDDWDLWFKIAKSSSFLCRDRLALKYRRHSMNASRNLMIILASTRRLIKKRLREMPRDSRARLRLRADRHLVGLMRTPLVLHFKRTVKSGRVTAAIDAFLKLLYFSLHLYRSPRLLWGVIHSLLPGSWINEFGDQGNT